MPDQAAGSIAYLLTGFPRLSETFIASEIHRLEQRGLRLRLFVLKLDDTRAPHPVVARIAARPDYLPRTASFTHTPFLRWLVRSLPTFLPGMVRIAWWRPRGFAHAIVATVDQAWRARRDGSWPPRVVKEFLQATALADRLRRAPDVRHLHAHFCHGTATVAWLASMISGIPFSFTAHARDLYQASLNPGGLLRRKIGAARFAVTCTEANRRHLAGIADGVPVHCVYHGLNADLARLLAAAPSGPTPTGPPIRALGVGRVVPKKGFDVLVEACSLVRARHPLGVVGMEHLEPELVVGQPCLSRIPEQVLDLRADVVRDRVRRVVDLDDVHVGDDAGDVLDQRLELALGGRVRHVWRREAA